MNLCVSADDTEQSEAVTAPVSGGDWSSKSIQYIQTPHIVRFLLVLATFDASRTALGAMRGERCRPSCRGIICGQSPSLTARRQTNRHVASALPLSTGEKGFDEVSREHDRTFVQKSTKLSIVINSIFESREQAKGSVFVRRVIWRHTRDTAQHHRQTGFRTGLMNAMGT